MTTMTVRTIANSLVHTTDDGSVYVTMSLPPDLTEDQLLDVQKACTSLMALVRWEQARRTEGATAAATPSADPPPAA